MSGQPDLGTLSPLIDLLAAADSDAQRALLLLRVPHAFVAGCGAELREVCRRAGFSAGAAFVAVREAYALAVLDGLGGNPWQNEYDTRRAGMMALASGVVPA